MLKICEFSRILEDLPNISDFFIKTQDFFIYKSMGILDFRNYRNFKIIDFQKSKKYFQKSFFEKLFCFPKINDTQDSIPLVGVRKR